MAKHLLVTGGCGFIGHDYIRQVLSDKVHRVTNFDKLTYAGNLENLREVADNPDYRFVKGDIANREDVEKVFSEKIDYVVNFAAESHVDRSIIDPDAFMTTNIMGTYRLLEAARKSGVEDSFRFRRMRSTDLWGPRASSARIHRWLQTARTPLRKPLPI